jgi:hypothetical protein
MQTKDIHGNELQRGDFVQLTTGTMLPDYENASNGPGQIEHIFTEGKMKGIHIRFKEGVRVLNTGLGCEKIPFENFCD